MPSVQIKDVPDEVHRELRRRATAANQSLQEYLLTWLIEETSHPTLDQVLERIALRSGGSVPLALATELIRAERDRD